MSVLEKLLQDLNLHTKYNLVYLRAIAMAVQQKEQEKVPSEWQPTYFVCHDALAQQALPRSISRASFTVQNQGPSAVLLSNNFFDGPNIAAQIAANRYGGTYKIMLLASGGTTSIPSNAPCWAYSVNYGTGTNEQAVLQMVESMYGVVPGFRAGTVGEPGHNRKELEGLADDDNLDTEVTVLR